MVRGRSRDLGAGYIKKTLIINGSPRVNGDCAELIRELRRHLHGDTVEVSAFRSKIAPCVDCRGCHETARCVVYDEMAVINDDDFDNAVLATPVHFMSLPGPVLSLLSRFQPQHAAEFLLNKPLKIRPKKAGLILTAGGKGNEAGVDHHVFVMFKMLNASGYEEHNVKSLNTDTIPAKSDKAALEDARKLAEWLNAD